MTTPYDVDPSQRRPAVTIADVALASGVSPSTASRAYNHPHLLKAGTVVRVKKAARELGFRHNRYAKALSTGRSSALGLIVPDLSNPFFPPLVHATQLAAEARGFSLYIVSSEHDAAREQQLAGQIIPDVGGLILASPRMSVTHIQRIAAQVPTVLINAQVDGLPSVLVSARVAIAQAVEDGFRAGITGLAYMGSEERWWPNIEREQSAHLEALSRSLPFRRLYIKKPTYKDAYDQVSIMELRSRELLIAFDDIVAHGALSGLSARGVHAPKDFSILGCDDALPIDTRPSLSTVHLDTATAAQQALDLLLSGTPAGLRQPPIVVSGTYRRGDTL